nr:hypothetical protein [Tanacetum cinerariifolium]
MHKIRGDGVIGIKRRRRELYGDGVRNLATASERGRLKEDLESSTWRRRQDFNATSREIPSFDEPEPQPQPFFIFPSLEVDLGEERDPEPPSKPPSPDSFRMKEVDHLTIHTPPSPHVASFHPKDTYCYYHPCIDDPKRHYGFKPGLL